MSLIYSPHHYFPAPAPALTPDPAPSPAPVPGPDPDPDPDPALALAPAPAPDQKKDYHSMKVNYEKAIFMNNELMLKFDDQQDDLKHLKNNVT